MRQIPIEGLFHRLNGLLLDMLLLQNYTKARSSPHPIPQSSRFSLDLHSDSASPHELGAVKKIAVLSSNPRGGVYIGIFIDINEI